MDVRRLRLCWEQLRVAEILEDLDMFKGIDHLRDRIKTEWKVTYQAVRARQHPDAFLKELIHRSKGLPHAPRFTRGLRIPPEIEAALLKSRKRKPKY